MAHKVTEQMIVEMLAICSHPKEEILKSSDLREQFARAYRNYSGTNICCVEAIPELYEHMQMVIAHFNKNKMKENPKSAYRLRPGVMLYFRERATKVSNANLTDEVAAHMLNVHPEWAQHFEKLPEGGKVAELTEEQAAAHAAPATKEQHPAKLRTEKAPAVKKAPAEKKVRTKK